MKRISSAWLIAVSLLSLVACKVHSDGSEFLGEWVSSANPADKVVIKRDGDNYVISKADQKFVATYSDGVLTYKLAGVPTQCSYTEGTETMTCSETSYTHV